MLARRGSTFVGRPGPGSVDVGEGLEGRGDGVGAAAGAGGEGSHDEGFAGFGGDHDDGDIGCEVFAASLFEEGEAVHGGHVDVGEDEVEWAGVVAQEDESFLAVAGVEDFGEVEAGLTNGALDDLAHDG